MRVTLPITFLALAGTLTAEPVRVGHVAAELLADHVAIQPGQSFMAGLRLKTDEHWHTYWKNPGDAGQATSLAWSLPPGFEAGAIQWPTPQRFPLGPVTSYGYDGDTLLLTEIAVPMNATVGTSLPLRVHVEWLVCSDECIPGETDLALELPVETSPTQAAPEIAALFRSAHDNLPRNGSSRWAAAFGTSGNEIVLQIQVPNDTEFDLAQAYFFAADEGTIAPAEPQAARLDNGMLTIRMKRFPDGTATPAMLTGILSVPGASGPQGIAINATPGAISAAMTSSATLIGTLISAFLGGLILNLMPCVFPVLGIKILGFVNQAGTDRRKVVLHGLVFTAGVLLSFWVLAGALLILRNGGAQLGWGFQLQSAPFVFGLAVLLLVFGLNMSGVFEFGLSATSVGSSLQMRTGFSGSFFTGVLATVVSTPCAAPFLAPALGAALALPATQGLILFTVIALGLSTPYLVLSIFPRLVNSLPRPGAWMETFKQCMAFPLYGTTAFLIWVLAGQLDENSLFGALLGLVLIALAAWAYGRWTQQGAHGLRRSMGYAVAATAFLAGIGLGWPRQDSHEIAWESWSPEAVERLQAEGKTVYVDFTARWCATCKVNKIAVFSSPEVRTAFAREEVVPLKADWTKKDPLITQALAKFGRSAVPFNLIYGPGSSDPIILPEVLTPGIVLDAIAQAQPTSTARTIALMRSPTEALH